jgi:hypothetical protein
MLGEESTELILSHDTMLQTIRDGIMVPFKQERKQCKVVLKRGHPVAFSARTLVSLAYIFGELIHIVAPDLI